jgi:hypothetical protein
MQNQGEQMHRIKNVRLGVLACTLVLALATSLLAADKGKAKGPKASVNEAKTLTEPTDQPASARSKEPWIAVTVDISPAEREIIRSYVHSCTVTEGRGKRPKGLPPGLAKKVARGGDLPPGWKKKCVRGEIMSVEVYKQCHPLPAEVVVKLPPSPHGTILVAIEGKVVRLVKATREILDVFDIL